MDHNKADLIKKQVDALEDDEVQELALDEIHFQKFNPTICKALEAHKETLLFLSINNCGITSLEHFPKLDKLIRIELTDNKIHGSELSHIAFLKDLQSVNLGGNPLTNFSDLEALKGLKELLRLDLVGTPLSEKDNYREKVFEMFPSLKILDNKDSDGNEVDYAEEDEDDDEEGGDYDEEDEDGDDDEDGGDDDEEDEDNGGDDSDEEEQPKKKVKKN